MTADRNLLELAAKAAGLPIEFKNTGNWLAVKDDDGEELLVHWNPLSNDGDALRLAVVLRLHIALETNHVSVWQMYGRFTDEPIPEGSDANAAVRRCIVRAAAALVPKGKR